MFIYGFALSDVFGGSVCMCSTFGVKLWNWVIDNHNVVSGKLAVAILSSFLVHS